MKIKKKKTLIIDLSVEAEKFEAENGTSAYYEDYRRDNKLKLVGDLESPMLRWLSKTYPSSCNPKIKVISTEPLTVKLKFDMLSILYPEG